MKKWAFWATMCIASMMNGFFFFVASRNSMSRGIEGVDNQGALLFIPLLWIVAFFVIAVINVYTAVRGIKIEKSRTIDLLAVFHLSGLSPKAKIGRIAFLAVCGFLVVFGYCLFAQDTIWAVSYALSGGVLLVFLYAWAAASKHSNKGKAGAS